MSNFPAWLLAWAVALQDREGWAPFVSLQPQYSLVERSIELELLPFCRAAGLGVIPWGPLGAGFLTGRYKRGERPPEGSRIADAGETLEEAYERRAIERNFRVVDAAGEIAEARGATIPQVALAWLLGTEGVTAPIVGPRTFEQLEDVLGADGLELTADERARLEAPAPPPPLYPQRMLREQIGHRRTAARGSERAEQPLEVGVVVPGADRRAHSERPGRSRTTTPASASRSRVPPRTGPPRPRASSPRAASRRGRARAARRRAGAPGRRRRVDAPPSRPPRALDRRERERDRLARERGRVEARGGVLEPALEPGGRVLEARRSRA